MRCFCLDSNGQWLVSLFVTVVKILLSKAPGSGSIAYNQLCHRHRAQYRDGGEELNDGIIGSTKAMLVAFDPIGAPSRGRAGGGRARGKKAIRRFNFVTWLGTKVVNIQQKPGRGRAFDTNFPNKAEKIGVTGTCGLSFHA